MTGVKDTFTGLFDWKFDAAPPNGCLIEQVSDDGPEQKPTTKWNFHRVYLLTKVRAKTGKDRKVPFGEGGDGGDGGGCDLKSAPEEFRGEHRANYIVINDPVSILCVRHQPYLIYY